MDVHILIFFLFTKMQDSGRWGFDRAVEATPQFTPKTKTLFGYSVGILKLNQFSY